MPVVCLAILAALAAPPIKPALPAKYPPAVAENTIKTIYRSRESAEGWLRDNAQSYLAAVQRKDFAGKASLTVGRAPDNDLKIDDPLIQPHHLRVTVVGDSFHVVALDDSARFRIEDSFEPRDTTVGPSSIMLGKEGALWGRYNLRLSHQNAPALILLDALSARFKQFHGLRHYPVDLTYRFLLPMTRNPRAGDSLWIASTRGTQRKAIRLGWFDFMVGKKPCRLSAFRMLEPGINPNNTVVFFRDATSGKETSAMGRYLEAIRFGANYLLDFNRAENPVCVFSNLYNCPIPPKENTLKVPIRAGEKDVNLEAVN